MIATTFYEINIIKLSDNLKVWLALTDVTCVAWDLSSQLAT